MTAHQNLDHLGGRWTRRTTLPVERETSTEVSDGHRKVTYIATNVTRIIPMDGLLPSVTNTSLNWTWLGHIIASREAFTLQVFCLGAACKLDILYQMFATRAVPWMSLDNSCELPSVSGSDTIVILSDSPRDTEQAITRAASVVNAYRARYFLVLYGYIEEKVIQALVSLAWAKRLAQVVAVRLEDSAIYTVRPKCQEPRVIQVPTVQWPNLKRLNLNGCTLKIAVSSIPPFVDYNGDSDDAFLGGFLIPYYTYVKAGLKFRALLIPTPHPNISQSVREGKTDLSFVPSYFTPNMTLDLSFPFSTTMGWCVPDSCVLGATSQFLWREFTWNTWIILVASAFAVGLSICWMTPPNTLTLVDAVFLTLSTLASSTAKLPDGHVRSVLVGWLFGILVLSTGYQTALHSMMAAPSFVQEISDAHQLLASKTRLICVTDTSCPILINESEGDRLLTALAGRSEKMTLEVAIQYTKMHENTTGFYNLHHVCKYYLTGMSFLTDKVVPVQLGYFAVTPSSLLAPALRRLGSVAEASGLVSLWSKRDVEKLSCSSPKNKRDLQPITVALLWPALLLMFCGFTFALIVFLMELCWKRCRNLHYSIFNVCP